MKNTITLQEYLDKIQTEQGQFIIPTYQRGYVWGQEKGGQKVDSVTNILNTLLDGYEKKKEVFLQGITVYEAGDQITLVDGQQRTTFFYLLLKYLEYDRRLAIHYAIREESNEFLKTLNVQEIIGQSPNDDEEFQDWFFFKKTIRLINTALENVDKGKFKDYILTNVRFLYITIQKEKASIVFSMMNGNKAQMLNEELIKSELLRCASLKTEGGLISEAENTGLRSRLAREWDTWLHWWNMEEHQLFFHTQVDNRPIQLGWLIPLVDGSEKVDFELFRKNNLENATVKSAKLVFKKMRLMQKSIEDAYNDPKIYNEIGAILHFRDAYATRFTFLKWYFSKAMTTDKVELKRLLTQYYDWSMLGMNHKDITDNNQSKFIEAREEFRANLEDDQLYRAHYEVAARWLLRLNIAEDSRQESDMGRKFDFEIWRQRSLEHIYPKSKVGHIVDGEIFSWDDKILKDDAGIEMWREDIKFRLGEDGVDYQASEHSIGNLVLMYKDDNSRFRADDFQSKKKTFFENVGDSMFKSRHLIHTISVFANSSWNEEDIARHKKAEIDKFDKQYSVY